MQASRPERGLLALRQSARAWWNRPLYRNGYALILSSALASGLGFIYWWVAARLYPPETVGLNSAVLSAMLFLSGLAQLSLNGVLVRFLPMTVERQPQARRLVLSSYLASLGASLLATLGFAVWLRMAGEEFQPFFSSPAWLVWFALGTLAWSIFSLQDSVLTGLRQTLWVPLENAFFALAKLLLLVLLASAFPRTGIFLAWILAVLLLLPPVNGLIFGRLLAGPARPGPGQLPRRKDIFHFIGGNYLGSLFSLASSNLLPVLVAVQAGVEMNAYFYLAWMITSVLQMLSTNLVASLTVEAAMHPDRLYAYGYRVLVHSSQLLLLPVLVVLAGAPVLLQLFGKVYAVQGAALLRLLALGALPNVVIALYIGLARVRQQAGRVALVQGTLSLLILGGSYLLLPGYGLVGVGAAWLASQALVAVLLLLTGLRPVFQERGARL